MVYVLEGKKPLLVTATRHRPAEQADAEVAL